jgi:urocanate hydratase
MSDDTKEQNDAFLRVLKESLAEHTEAMVAMMARGNGYSFEAAQGIGKQARAEFEQRTGEKK